MLARLVSALQHRCDEPGRTNGTAVSSSTWISLYPKFLLMHALYPGACLTAAYRCSQVQVFREVCRVLKPGSMFGGYEWVVTEKYDSSNPDHVRLKEGIEVGNGLPTLATPAIIKANLEEAGFEV